jgi:hypothetical protein
LRLGLIQNTRGRARQGTLVALWITNRERHLRFAEEELLPAWGLQRVGTWYVSKLNPGLAWLTSRVRIGVNKVTVGANLTT